MEPDWKFNSFDQLSAFEVYTILRLRNEVFVVEQNCVYQDADNKDSLSYHLSGWDDTTLVAYCRLLPPGISFPEASIGRVVISPGYRHLGYGRKLMELAVGLTLKQFTCKQITIGAQLYLETFYQSLGFVRIGETYLEDNISHIEMQFTI
ncbi:MAG: GNAT family N-acetyltransferase [Ferruginibacter sp.]|nr:GNAT family N-acetyltransferase [Ferruginibacter sp.]